MFPTLLRRLGVLPRLVFFLLALGAVRPALASHLLGGEMSYQYKGQVGTLYSYQINVITYYNPPPSGNVAVPAGSVPVTIYNATGGGLITSVAAPLIQPIPATVQPHISSGCTVVGPSQPFKILRYTVTVSLPGSLDGYYAVCTQTARNNALTNVNNPNNNNGNIPMSLYVSMVPPLGQYIPNRSPIFSDTAVAIVCQNDTTVLLNSAVDPDGDRLIYSFGTPYGTFVTATTSPPTFNPVPYNPGYSTTNPLGTGAGNFALINASTGVAKYGGTAQGQYAIAVDVKEFRTINGREVLIGTTRRDLQLLVSQCPSTLAPVLPPVTRTPRSYTIEEGQSLSVPITATQADGHPLVLTLNSLLLDGPGGFNTTFNGSTGTVVAGNPTGTATATGTGTVAGTLVYNSACGDARANPYDVAFSVKDNGCAGKTTADVLRITVTRPSGPNAISGDAVVCSLGTVSTYQATGGTAPGLRWRVVGGTFVGGNTGSTVQVRWATAGTGTIVAKGVSTYGCLTDSVAQTVTVAPAGALTLTGNLTVCQGTGTTLTVAGAAGPYTLVGGGITLTGAGPFTLTPTQTTTYTVTSGATALGCTSTQQVTVTVVPLPAANVGQPTRATCSGVPLTLGAAPVAGNTYSWSPATGLSSATVANPTLTLTNTTGAPIVTTYTLTETTATGGCTATNSVAVTVNPLPTPVPGAGVAFCSGGSAQLGAAPVSGFTYSWSPATGLSSPTAANPTVTLTNTTFVPVTSTYTLTVTNTATGCVNTGTVAVTVNPLPPVVPGGAVTFCSGGSAQLGAAPDVGGFTYSWSPTTGLNSPNSPSPTVTLTNTTNAPVTVVYTLTVTNTATGCVNTGTVAVTVNPLPIAVPGAAVATCSGVPVAIGGPAVAGLAYSWSPATGLSSPTAANPTVTLTNTTGAPVTTTYTLTVTNTATSCVSTGTVAVTVNPLPTALPGAAVMFCSGGSAQLGATPVAGFTYSWSPATGLSSTTVANPTVTLTNTTGAPVTTTYTLTVTNTATSCVSTGTVAVTVNPLPVVATGAATTICSGSSAQLGAAPVSGFAYSWTPATGLSSTTVANPTVTLTNTTGAPVTTTYTLTVTNTATSCVSTGTVAVTVNPAATATAGPAQAVCDKSTITLGAAALPGYSYRWTPALNLSSATVAQPVLTGVNLTNAPLIQKYVVLATTALGCSTKDSVLITINPRPVADSIAGPQSVCPTVLGIAYSIKNPHSTAYQWTVTGGTLASGQGTAAITVNWGLASTGAVSVTSSNAQGCVSDVRTLPVLINQLLQTARPTGPASVCQADGPYAYSTPAINGSSFAWQLYGTANGTLVSTGNTTSIRFGQAGIAKLVVTQTSNPSGGICRGVSDTLYITVKPSPSATISIQGPARFCMNSGPQTYALPGTAGSTYVFQLNGVAIANTNGTVVIPASTAAGTYTLTARETNTGGCAGQLFSKTFTVDPLPGTIVINGPRFVCPATRTLTYTVPNATATSTYQWTVTGGTVASGQGTATITVNFGALSTTNATVSVTETSQFGCGGAAVAITVVPDNAQTPLLTLASVVPTDNTKVTLTFLVTNAAATPTPLRVLRRDAGSTGAFAQVGTVAATATTFVDATANAAQTAYEYSLALTNGCGDVFTANATATTMLLKTVAVPGPGGRNQGSTSLSWSAYQGFAVAGYRLYAQNDNAGGYSLLTTLPGTTLQYSVPNTGQGFNQCYRVVAFSGAALPVGVAPAESNSNTACVDFANKTAFYNIITPNNDGQNDLLFIDNVQLYPGNSLTIFNRWGREVFATTNYNNTSNAWGSDPAIAAGVYYYLFKLADGTSTKGWVEVVK